MKSLGRVLRKHIENNKYTIYKVAHKSGINRTTLQKVLSDDRSASKELLENLLPVLKLSPDEEAEIWNMFEAAHTDETIYAQRRYIKQLIGSLTSLEHLFYTDLSDSFFQFSPSGTPDLPDQSPSPAPPPIYGIYNIERLLSSFFLEESRRSEPEILISAPGNLPVLEHMFVYDLHHCRTPSKIKVKHITPLLKSPMYSSPLVNLEILSNILPFTISQAFRYEVYCFYRNELPADSTQDAAFPYYIVFSHAVILLSSNIETAFSFTDFAVIQYFQDLFHSSLKKARPLITTYFSPKDILKSLIQSDQPNRPLHTIEYQPCFAAFLTEEMIYKYVRPELSEREELIQYLLLRCKQLENLDIRSCIFSRAGLDEFSKTGFISDLPSCYVLPLEPEDRIRLLEALCERCRESPKQFLLVNPITLSLPRHLSIAIRREHSIAFSGFGLNGISYNYIHITEPTILEAFEDFYDYLTQSRLINTQKETLSEIEKQIRSLRTNF